MLGDFYSGLLSYTESTVWDMTCHKEMWWQNKLTEETAQMMGEHLQIVITS